MRLRVAILGAGGHARVVADTLRLHREEFEIWGFLDDDPARVVLDRIPRRGSIADLPSFVRQFDAVAVAIGDNVARLSVSQRAAALGCRAVTIRHPAAAVADSAAVGHGVMLAAASVVQAGACLADYVLVNTAATVDHDCRVETAAHIAPGVHLAGGVHIGARTLVGIGSVVAPGISIGNDVVLGAGSVVVRDIPDGVIAYGSPARVVRMRKDTD